MNDHDAPMYEDISEYQACKLKSLNESLETWKEVFGGKRLITFEGFDDIFGHILGDPDIHFGIFVGDDVKRRLKMKAAALAKLRKQRGTDALGLGALDNAIRRRRTRSGSSFNRSSLSKGSFSVAFSGNSVMGQSISMIAMEMANKTSTSQEPVRPSAAQLDKYKRGAMIDVFDVFVILALLSNEEVEAKLTFLFIFFARSGSRRGGLDHMQFQDLIERVTSAVFKLLGNCEPDKKFAKITVLSIFGKNGNTTRDVLTFKDTWDWCQDEIEVANYLQKVFQFCLTPNSMYKQGVAVHTDSYLQNSKLMEGDDSDDEDASGIDKTRAPLWNELVKTMSTKDWWKDMPTAQENEFNLIILRKLWTTNEHGISIFSGKRFRGVIDVMNLACCLIKAWNSVPNPSQEGDGEGGGKMAKEKLKGAARESENAKHFAAVCADFCYRQVNEGLLGDDAGRVRAGSWELYEKARASRKRATGDGAKGLQRKSKSFNYSVASEPIPKEGVPSDPSEPVLVNQFVYNVFYRFAQDARCVLIATNLTGDPSNYIHIINQIEVARWLNRRMELLGKWAKEPLQKQKRLLRKPLVVPHTESARDAFAKLVEKKCGAAAIVDDMSGRFVAELRIEDIRKLARKRVNEGETLETGNAEDGRDVGGKDGPNWTEIARLTNDNQYLQSNEDGSKKGKELSSSSSSSSRRLTKSNEEFVTGVAKSKALMSSFCAKEEGGIVLTGSVESDLVHLSLLGELLLPVCKFLVKEGEEEEKATVKKKSPHSILEKVCAAFALGIGPANREKRKDNQKKTRKKGGLSSKRGSLGKASAPAFAPASAAALASVSTSATGSGWSALASAVAGATEAATASDSAAASVVDSREEDKKEADVDEHGGDDGSGEAVGAVLDGSTDGNVELGELAEKIEKDKDKESKGKGSRGPSVTGSKVPSLAGSRRPSIVEQDAKGWDLLRSKVRSKSEVKGFDEIFYSTVGGAGAKKGTKKSKKEAKKGGDDQDAEDSGALNTKNKKNGDVSPKHGQRTAGIGRDVRLGNRLDTTVRMSDTLARVINVMSRERKSRVFITNSAGSVTGVICVADICRLALDEAEKEVIRIVENNGKPEESEETQNDGREDLGSKIADKHVQEAAQESHENNSSGGRSKASSEEEIVMLKEGGGEAEMMEGETAEVKDGRKAVEGAGFAATTGSQEEPDTIGTLSSVLTLGSEGIAGMVLEEEDDEAECTEERE